MPADSFIRHDDPSFRGRKIEPPDPHLLFSLLHIYSMAHGGRYNHPQDSLIRFSRLNPLILTKKQGVFPRRVTAPLKLGYKNTPRRGRTFSWLLLSLVGKTIAAIYRTIVAGLERNLAGFSAGSAYGIEHLARCSSIVFTGVTAGFASLRFVRKSFFLKEILFARGENEFIAAVFAYQRFVLMHQMKYLFKKIGA